MIFASRTRESLNNDPSRIVVLDRDGQVIGRFPTMKAANYYRSAYVPVRSARTAIDRRPEFTPKTTHDANPILVAFRASEDKVPRRFYADFIEGFCETPTGTPEQIDHARRVLDRLAAWHE